MYLYELNISKKNYSKFQEDSPTLEKDKLGGDFDSQRDDAIKVRKNIFKTGKNLFFRKLNQALKAQILNQ